MAMNTAIENVSIIGAGALGGIYASIFYRMDNQCVSFIAAGERYERLRREGLVVNGKLLKIQVLRPDDPLPPSDLIIVAVKQHQLNDAVRDMKMRVGPQTTIISVMNGLDSEKVIAAFYGEEKILYAVAVGIDAVREKNRINFSRQGKILFGEARNPSVSGRVKRVQDFFARAGIVFETPSDMIHIL